MWPGSEWPGPVVVCGLVVSGMVVGGLVVGSRRVDDLVVCRIIDVDSLVGVSVVDLLLGGSEVSP